MRFAIIFLFSFVSFAGLHPHQLNKSENRNFSQITVDEDYGSLVTEGSFYQIASQVFSLYSQLALEKNKKIIIKVLDWKVPYFSAWAHKEDENTFSVNFWGGLARLPHMTKAAFALTACHEIGHILGGAPYIKIPSMSHMSSEGQSDYFAAALCLKRFDGIFTLPIETEVDPYITSLCFEKFAADEPQFETCLKVSVAGLALSKSLAFLMTGDSHHLDVATPSQNEVNETLYNSYPDVQCRLDTFIAGALSNYDHKNPFESSDAHLRPRCWFAN